MDFSNSNPDYVNQIDKGDQRNLGIWEQTYESGNKQKGESHTIPDLDLLCVWEIPKEYLSLSDHKLILLEQKTLEKRGNDKQHLAITGWSILNLLENENLRQVAKDDEEKYGSGQNGLTLFSTNNDLDKEVE